MDGHYSFDASAVDIKRQFITDAMIDINLVFQQVIGDPIGAPPWMHGLC